MHALAIDKTLFVFLTIDPWNNIITPSKFSRGMAFFCELFQNGLLLCYQNR